MGERYTRVFTLPQELYVSGAPVVIAAGALLKDGETGQVLAQLKLRNVQERVIRAVKVRLTVYEPAGAPLGEPLVHQYLDLAAGADGEFGQKTPVRLAEPAARSFTAAVTEVVFADQGPVWTGPADPWGPMPAGDAMLLQAERERRLEAQARLQAQAQAEEAARAAARKAERSSAAPIWGIGILMSLAGLLMIVKGAIPNAAYGITLRVVFLLLWTVMLLVTGLLLTLIGFRAKRAEDRKRLLILPLLTGLVTAASFVGFFILTY